MTTGEKFWGLPEAERERLQDERAELIAAIMDLSEMIACLNAQLVPVWQQEDDVKAALAQTYRLGERGTLMPNWDGIETRRPLFEELTAIAIGWGKVKAGRSQLVSLRKAYTRELTGIDKILTSQQRRKRRKSHG